MVGAPDEGVGDRGDGKRADFGRALPGGGPGDGDGEDCLMNGLLRTVPMLQCLDLGGNWSSRDCR